MGEIAACERAAWKGGYVERPFLILAQPSLFDDTRAPAGKHTAWAFFMCGTDPGKVLSMRWKPR